MLMAIKKVEPVLKYCTTSWSVDQIARVCHEANRELQRQAGEVVNFPWENTSEALRGSARDGVRAFLERGLTARQAHANWMRYKEAEGWSYGPIKDFAVKMHPLLLPWAGLSDEERAKDELFVNICRALTVKA